MSVITCKFHPGVQAADNCNVCHSAICLNDVRRYGLGIFCPDCYEKTKSKTRRHNILVGGFLVISFGLMILFAIWFQMTGGGYY